MYQMLLNCTFSHACKFHVKIKKDWVDGNTTHLMKESGWHVAGKNHLCVDLCRLPALRVSLSCGGKYDGGQLLDVDHPN